MFIGKFYHSLEKNNRLSLPKNFRSKNNKWVVTRGLDGCLFLFSQDKFEQEIKNIAQRSLTKKSNRDLTRLMTNEAVELIADKLGRVKLPNYLTEFAGLNKQLVVVGSFSRIEIWDQTTYHAYIDKIEPQAEQIAEQIDTNGVATDGLAT